MRLSPSIRNRAGRRSAHVLVVMAVLATPMALLAPPVAAVPTTPSSPQTTAPSSSPSAFPAPMAAPALPADAPTPAPPAALGSVPQPPADLAVPASAPVPAGKDPVSIAVAEARRTGKRVEVVSSRTENTTTYANPDATLTTDVAAGPVRVAKGKDLVPVDATLVSVNGKVIPRAAKGETRCRAAAVPPRRSWRRWGQGRSASAWAGRGHCRCPHWPATPLPMRTWFPTAT